MTTPIHNSSTSHLVSSSSGSKNINATPRPVPDIIIPSEALPGKVLGTPVWQRKDEGKLIYYNSLFIPFPCIYHSYGQIRWSPYGRGLVFLLYNPYFIISLSEYLSIFFSSRSPSYAQMNEYECLECSHGYFTPSLCKIRV